MNASKSKASQAAAWFASRLTAKGQMKGVTLDPSLLKPEDKDMLEDLIVAAHDDARKKGERVMEERMQSLTAGLPLPPGFKLPF